MSTSASVTLKALDLVLHSVTDMLLGNHAKKSKVEQFIAKVCKQEDLNIKELKSGSRRESISMI